MFTCLAKHCELSYNNETKILHPYKEHLWKFFSIVSLFSVISHLKVKLTLQAKTTVKRKVCDYQSTSDIYVSSSFLQTIYLIFRFDNLIENINVHNVCKVSLKSLA